MGSITHTKVTGAPADPSAIVDGPAWDAAHTFSLTPSDVGLGNVPNVNATNADNIAAGSQTGTGAMVRASAIRERLTGSRTYYVRSDGSDSNLGLTDTSGGAFLTWAHAISVITSSIDFAGFAVTLFNGNAATFATAIIINAAWTGGGNLIIDLNGGTISAANAITTNNGVSLPGLVTLQNGTITQIIHAAVGQIQLAQPNSGITFSAAAGRHMQATSPGAYINAGNTTYTIAGGSGNHFLAADQGRVDIPFSTISFTADMAFTTFAFAERGALITASGATFTLNAHTITGQRFNTINGAVIDTNGGGANFFPGNSAGTGTNPSVTPWGLYI